MTKTTEPGETIEEMEGEKSNLLLEAQMLMATGNEAEAISRFALAAPKEERIAAYYEQHGESALAAQHRFSAAVCRAKSGNLYDAITLFDALSESPDTPGRLKVDALLFAARLREQQRNVLQSYAHFRQVSA
jgi:hypothetical protein